MKTLLHAAFPPSIGCDCEICTHFCTRPGWWTVSEAREAIARGFAPRMMIEFSRDLTRAVLSPAFKGNESYYAFGANARNGCTFLSGNLRNGQCELYNTGLMPLECRYCHHDREGAGLRCHEAIGEDWNSSKGRRLVKYWCTQRGLPFQGSMNML